MTLCQDSPYTEYTLCADIPYVYVKCLDRVSSTNLIPLFMFPLDIQQLLIEDLNEDMRVQLVMEDLNEEDMRFQCHIKDDMGFQLLIEDLNEEDIWFHFRHLFD